VLGRAAPESDAVEKAVEGAVALVEVHGVRRRRTIR
jgi:hypothetical protein